MPRTVLLVDDEASVRFLVSSVLESQGFHVLNADDGDTALDLFRANCDEVELVVTDVMMPRMNGLDLTDHLTASRPELPVVYMTGFDGGKLQAKASRPHTRVLRKPFQIADLISSVRELLPAEATA